MKKLMVFLLCSAISFPTGAVYFDPETGRPVSRQSAGGLSDGHMGIDPVLMERSTKIREDGYSPVGAWVGLNTSAVKHLTPEAINACGRTLLTDLFNAPDRTNYVGNTEAGIMLAVVSRD